MSWGPLAWGQGRESKGDWKEHPQAPRWTWGPELLPAYWARSPLPLPTRKPARPPRPAAWASPSCCFFYGFLKLPTKTAKAKGSTCLSQAKSTCPSTLVYSQKFLHGPEGSKGNRKQLSCCRSFPTRPGLLELDYETRDTDLGYRKGCYRLAANGS